MKQDHIRAFLYKPPVGGATCQLVADQGLGSIVVVNSWTREQCEAAANPPNDAAEKVDLVQELEAAAQGYADQTGEAVRLTLRWLNRSDRPLKTGTHTAAPEVGKDGNAGSAVTGAPISANTIIAELLNALMQQTRVLPQATTTVLLAYERALTMQQRVIESLAKLEEERPGAIGGVATIVRTAEEIEAGLRSQALKEQALGKLIDIGPSIARLAMAAGARALELDPSIVESVVKEEKASH